MSADFKTSETIDELAAALATAQGEFPAIEKRRKATAEGISRTTGKPYSLSYSYADIADVLSAVLPVLSKHKLAVVQPTVIAEQGVFIKTRLLHASGQWVESAYPVASVSGDHQRMGGAVTYARRYALCALIGVAADEDVDGRGAEELKPRRRVKKAQRIGPTKGVTQELPPAVAWPNTRSTKVSGREAPDAFEPQNVG